MRRWGAAVVLMLAAGGPALAAPGWTVLPGLAGQAPFHTRPDVPRPLSMVTVSGEGVYVTPGERHPPSPEAIKWAAQTVAADGAWTVAAFDERGAVLARQPTADNSSG